MGSATGSHYPDDGQAGHRTLITLVLIPILVLIPFERCTGVSSRPIDAPGSDADNIPSIEATAQAQPATGRFSVSRKLGSAFATAIAFDVAPEAR